MKQFPMTFGSLALPIVAAALGSVLLAIGPAYIGGFLSLILQGFVQLPLFMVGLRFGVFPALLAGGLSAFGLGLFLQVIHGSGFLQAFSTMCLWNVIPVAALIFVLSLWRTNVQKKCSTSESCLISALMGLGIMTLITMPLLQSHLLDTAEFSTALEQSISGLPADQMDQVLSRFEMIQPFIPGFMTLFWCLLTLWNGLIAIWAMKKVKAPILRDSLSIENILLPTPFIFVLAGSGAIGYILNGTSIGALCANCALVISMGYVLMGLGSIKFKIQQHKAPVAFMGIIYALTLFLYQFAAIVALIGILEPWLQLRTKNVTGSAKKD